MKRLAFLIALVSLLAPVSAGAVGFQSLQAPDPQGQPLELGIWYPSDALASPQRFGPFEQVVAPNGSVSGRALPLVVISHGTGGSLTSHYDTALALAAAGFVVVAVTHTADNFRDQSGEARIVDRPRQISRALDYILSSWSGHDRLDPAKIGIFGFSAGGFTALAAVGGRPDFSKVATHCSDHPSEYACTAVARHKGEGFGAASATSALADARFKAAIIAAPALGFTFSADGLKEVTVPIELWRAADDRILPNPTSSEAVHEALGRPHEYVVVPNAGHFDFLPPCSDALAKAAPDICRSEPGFDRNAFHEKFNAAVVEFCKKALN
jgi:predicted dienelactone hydrolase